MNAPTVPQGKPSKKSPVAVKAPKKGTDYVVAAPSHERLRALQIITDYAVAAPSHERPGGLDIIMAANHSTLEY